MEKIEEIQENVWAALREHTVQMAELRLAQAETDRIVKENALQMKETDCKLDKVSRQLDKTDKMIGGLSNNTGLFAEEYFFNSLKKGNKILLGEKFDKLIKAEIVEDEDKKTLGELDIILINGKSVAIIEVKFRVREKHVDKVMKKVKPFRAKFPEYGNHKLYLGLASMVFDEVIQDKCLDNGIAVIKQVGDNVVIYDKNLKAF